jgi:hypothetical protein
VILLNFYFSFKCTLNYNNNNKNKVKNPKHKANEIKEWVNKKPPVANGRRNIVPPKGTP